MQGGELLSDLGVSRETLELLRDFSEQLEKWSRSINLIAPSTVGGLWNRHILDSAQLAKFAPAAAVHWCDLGSGGGLPGIVLSIIFCERTTPSFTLIESDKRKAAFLKMMIARYDLHARVFNARIEDVPSAQCDVISARALAPLSDLLPLIQRHIRDDGVAILPKGRGYEAEVEAARKGWHFDLEEQQSVIDDFSKLLIIRHIEQRDNTT